MDNISLFFLIFGLSNHSTVTDNLMTFGAEYLIYLTLVGMFIVTLKGKANERKALLLTILALPIAVIIIKIIHLFISEPRPFVSYDIVPLINHQADASFPSRHATIMAVVAFSYTYFKSKWASLFLILMLLVGLSRIYVGVHYPLDIIGGFVVGLISLIVTRQIVNLIKFRFFR